MLLTTLMLLATQDAPQPEPEEAPVARASWQSVALMTFSPDGKVLACENRSSPSLPAYFGQPCDATASGMPPEMLATIGGGTPPAKVAFETDMVFDETPLAPDPAWTAGYRISGQVRVRFEVTAEGKIENCRAERTGKEAWMAKLPTLCNIPADSFTARNGPDGKPLASSATMTVTMWAQP